MHLLVNTCTKGSGSRFVVVVMYAIAADACCALLPAALLTAALYLQKAPVARCEDSHAYSADVCALVSMACIFLCRSSGSQPIRLTRSVELVSLVVDVGARSLAVVLRCAPRSPVCRMALTLALVIGQLCF